MHLIMFDIDGTLSDTFDLDSLFVEAVSSELGLAIDDDWETYEHVTDSGILDEMLTRHWVEGFRAKIHDSVETRFFELMKSCQLRDPQIIREIPGARSLVELLSNLPGVTIAVATGGWRKTAELKLNTIGLDTTALSVATASDATERTAIMEIAERRALPDHTATRRTYFGDGAWDKRACQVLGYDFIAVGDRVEHHTAFEDLSDQPAILSVLGHP